MRIPASLVSNSTTSRRQLLHGSELSSRAQLSRSTSCPSPTMDTIRKQFARFQRRPTRGQLQLQRDSIIKTSFQVFHQTVMGGIATGEAPRTCRNQRCMIGFQLSVKHAVSPGLVGAQQWLTPGNFENHLSGGLITRSTFACSVVEEKAQRRMIPFIFIFIHLGPPQRRPVETFRSPSRSIETFVFH